MKNLITILFLFVSINAQDVLITIAGKKYNGKFLEQQPRHVLFKPDGSPNAQTIPITSINNIQLGNGTNIEFGKDILTTKSGDTYKGYYLVTTETEVQFFIKKDMQAEFFDKNKIDNIKMSDGLIVDLELITKNMSEEGRKKYNEALNISQPTYTLSPVVKKVFIGCGCITATIAGTVLFIIWIFSDLPPV